MNEYPVGLLARTNYFRVLKSVWTAECKKFVLSRMKASAGNIQPVYIVNDVTKKVTCETPKIDLTGFFPLPLTGEIEITAIKIEGLADYMIKKAVIQLSNKTPIQKEKEIRDLVH